MHTIREFSPISSLQEIISDVLEDKRFYVPLDFSTLDGLYVHTWSPPKETPLEYKGQTIKKIRLIYGRRPKDSQAQLIPDQQEFCGLDLTFVDKSKKTIFLKVHEYTYIRRCLIGLNACRDESMSKASLDATFEEKWGTPYRDLVKTNGNPKTEKYYAELRPKFANEVVSFLKENGIQSVLVLEYGCGFANLLEQFIERCDANNIKIIYAIGTDLDEAAVERAKKRFENHAHKKKIAIFKADSRKLASTDQFNTLLREYKSSETSACIALSCGATNASVINNISDAVTIFKNLWSKNFKYIFLSGMTPTFCNPTIAKRSGYIFSGVKSFSANEDLFWLTQETDEAKLKKHHEKFGDYAVVRMTPEASRPPLEENPGLCSGHRLAEQNIRVGTTPNFFKRLTTVGSVEIMLTTIQEEKKFQEVVSHLEEKLWKTYPCVREKENIYAGFQAHFHHRREGLPAFIILLRKMVKAEEVRIFNYDEYCTLPDTVIPPHLVAYPYCILLLKLYWNYSDFNLSSNVLDDKTFPGGEALYFAGKESEIYVDLLKEKHLDLELFCDIVNYRINYFNATGKYHSAQHLLETRKEMEVAQKQLVHVLCDPFHY